MALSTLFIGRNEIELESVDSTNYHALEMCRKENVSEGTVILAHHQPNGRGQRGRFWQSEPGKNLLCSIILKPVFMNVQEQFCLNKAIALSVRNAVNTLFPSTNSQIKWPNDIMVNERKLAGILIENILSGRQIVSAVAGIGLNINQEVFPEDAGNPVSLKLLLNQTIDIRCVLEEILNHFEPEYLRFKSGKYGDIHARFDEALWRRGQETKYTMDGKTFIGKIHSVDENGCLLMETPEGVRAYMNGEIQIVI